MRRSSIEREVKLGVESLENRMLLAGTVKIAVRDGVLSITGDKRDNCVEVSSRRDQIEIDGCDGTRIRGEIGNKKIRHVNITMGEGDDQLTVGNLAFKGNVSIHMNEGRDEVSVDNVAIDGNVDIGMGKEDDELTIRRSSADNATIDGKEDDDRFIDRGGNEFDDFECEDFESGCKDED